MNKCWILLLVITRVLGLCFQYPLQAQCPDGFADITIILSTGEYANDNNWQLINTDTQEIYAQTSQLYAAYTTYEETICVPLGTPLSFTISCCINNEGGYWVQLFGLTVVSGSNYQYNQTTYFSANQPLSTDAELQTINLAPYLLSQPTPITCTIRNTGSNLIQNLAIYEQVNNEPPQIYGFTDLNLPSFASATLSLSNNWLPELSDQQQLRVWIGAVNNQPDENPANDTLALPLTILPFMCNRLALLEGFENASCTVCAATHTDFTNLLLANQSRAATLMYHTPFPGYDPLFFQNAADIAQRLLFYQIPGVPRLLAEGGLFNDLPTQLSASTLIGLKEVPALLGINLLEKITHPLPDSTLIQTTVYLRSALPLPASNNLHLFVALSEKEVLFDLPPGSTSMTDFVYVLRKLLPHANGLPLPALQPDSLYRFTFTYAVPPYVQSSELETVVFVQDTESHKVWQTYRGSVISGYNNGGAAQFYGAPFGYVNIQKQLPDCFSQSSGYITATPVPVANNAPFTIQWAHTTDTAFTQNNLAAGNYTLTITDATGLTTVINIALPDAPGFELNITTAPDEMGNTYATANISNGTPPFTYLWSNADTLPGITNLQAGDYSITVTDAFACSQTATFTIENTSFLNPLNKPDCHLELIPQTMGQQLYFILPETTLQTHITIISILGKTVANFELFSGSGGTNSFRFPPSLPQGVYLINISNSVCSSTCKIWAGTR